MAVNHEQMREWVFAHQDGELGPEARFSVDAHLLGCDTCRRDLDAWNRLSATLLPRERPPVSPFFTERTMARIRAASRPEVVPRWRAFLRWATPVAAPLAGVVAAAGIFLLTFLPAAPEPVATADVLFANGAEGVFSPFTVEALLDF